MSGNAMMESKLASASASDAKTKQTYLYVLSGKDYVRDGYDGGMGEYAFSRIVRGVSSPELMEFVCREHTVKPLDFANVIRITQAGEARKRKEKAHEQAVQSGLSVHPLPPFVDDTPVRLYLVRQKLRRIEYKDLVPNSHVVYADSPESAVLGTTSTIAIPLEDAQNDTSLVPSEFDEARATNLLRDQALRLDSLRQQVIHQEKTLLHIASLVSSLQ